MITIINQRTRGREKPFEPIVREAHQDDALKSLAIFEFGYGGQVIETPTSIRVAVRTDIIDCIDTTTFEGPEYEMAMIYKVAVCHLAINVQCREQIVDGAVNLAECLPQSCRGVPLYLSMMAGHFLGANSTRSALLMAFDVVDEADIKAGAQLKLPDLLAALQMGQSDPECVGKSLRGVMELCGVEPATNLSDFLTLA